MIDKKINNKELSQGLIIDNVEILPPTEESTLAQLRQKRQIPFIKIYGRVYYQVSELVEWANSKKVAIAE
ncbi:MAG: hypothetical protein PHS42_03685 [Sulfurimonas sp.]|nr:hypothetical protein [Sulfurimonas sp.]MDD3834554.1 hypothetical protein [Sulfurimonas sp.]